MGWAGTTQPLASYRPPVAPQSPIATQSTAPIGGGAPGIYSTPSGQGLNANSFPTSGFSSPNAFNYLMQVLGMGGMPTPGTAPGMQPQQPQGGGLAAMIQQMLSQFGQGPAAPPQSFTPNFNSGIKIQPGTINGATGPSPGPSPSPLSILNQYSGPLGNGGGYLSPRMTIQPIKNPIQYGR